MDDIPLVPTIAGSLNLLGSRGAEYQALDFLLVGSFGAKRNDDNYETAEHEHATAEVEPVEVEEYCLEPVVRNVGSIAIVNLGTQTCKTDDDTGEQTPHTTLGRGDV